MGMVLKLYTSPLSGLFDNTITFRKMDATIELPTFEAGVSGDIRFQFKTTTENGIFLQNTGAYHFIELKLVCKCSVLVLPSTRGACKAYKAM